MAVWNAKQRNEVLKIAAEKYGYTGGQIKYVKSGRISQAKGNQAHVDALSKALSGYSTERADGSEFFSEAFVQYRLGDGPIGKAYGDWLKSKGYK